MNHFVVNLKSYLMFEVLEGGWKNLVRDIEEAQTLDQVICAHDQYLHRICRKSLLRADDNGKSRMSNGHSTGSGLVTLGERIQELLSMCGEFCDFQEDLFGEALAAAERAAKKRCEAERRLTQGDWGFNSNEEIYDDDTFFGLSDAARLQDLDCISELFNEKIRALIKALNNKLHGGPLVAFHGVNYFATTNMATRTTSSSGNELSSPEAQDEHDSLRFLTFQLDQNKFYEPGK
jgi:Gamma tubulin complex component C-terminal